jgi:ankyrin repeat protein
MHKFYGRGLFRCPVVSCNRHRQGFDTSSKRDCHVAKHFRPFKCPISTCDYNTIGFETENDKKIHDETCHSSGCEIEGSWDEMDETLCFRLLCDAAATGDVGLVQTLSSHSAGKTFYVDFGKLLDAAIEGGSITVLELILSRIRDKQAIYPASKPFFNPESLHGAILGGHESLVPLLIRGLFAGSLESRTQIDRRLRLKDGTTKTITTGLTALHLAVIVQSDPMIMSLLEAGADVNATAPKSSSGKKHESWTPLHFAAEHGSELIIRQLIDNGAKLEATSYLGSPLKVAVKKGHLGAVRLLLEKGADLEHLQASRADHTPLSTAAQLGNDEMVQLLLRNGAKTETMNTLGWTALHCATSEAVVRTLIDGRAVIEARNKKGLTPLLTATEKGRHEIVRLLLSKGAKIEAIDDDGNTALHLTRSKDIAMALIDCGADIEARNKNGCTPLLTERRPHEIVRLLLSKGAKTEAIDDDGNTSLHLTYSEDVAMALIDCGANIDARNKKGRTPLLTAVMGGPHEIVRLLLSKGAKHDAMDNWGYTALHLTYSEDVAMALIDCGANIEARNKKGLTPLLNAKAKGKDNIVQLLLSKGARHESIDAEGNTELHLTYSEDVAMALIDCGANIEARNKQGGTPLLTATAKGQDKIVRLLLRKGAKTEAIDDEGNTALHLATDEDIALALIDCGANIEARNKQGLAPLLNAKAKGRDNIVQLLLRKGANPESEGNTELHLATSHDIAVALIDGGADIDARNKQGRTPLLTAVMEGKERIVWLLLRKGAKTESMDYEGHRALQYSLEFNSSEPIVWSLVDGGANIEARDKQGRTMLHIATAQGQKKIVLLLLGKGATPGSMDDEGNTALHLATDEDIALALIDCGANIEARNKQGLAPLLNAKAKGRDNIVQLLLRKGANPESEGNTELHDHFDFEQFDNDWPETTVGDCGHGREW